LVAIQVAGPAVAPDVVECPGVVAPDRVEPMVVPGRVGLGVVWGLEPPEKLLVEVPVVLPALVGVGLPEQWVPRRWVRGGARTTTTPSTTASTSSSLILRRRSAVRC